MRTLALDISLNVGWAFGSGGNIAFGTRSFQGVSGDCAILGRRFSAWLNELLTEHEPSDFVIESPVFFQGARGGATKILHGMAWEAHRAAEIRNIPRKEYAPISIKKFITGSSKAKKPEVMAAVRAKGYAITNDHEGDAVALLLLHESRAAA